MPSRHLLCMEHRLQWVREEEDAAAQRTASVPVQGLERKVPGEEGREGKTLATERRREGQGSGDSGKLRGSKGRDRKRWL